MAFTVIRYSERPELWEHSDAISHEVSWEEWTGMRFPGDGEYTFPLVTSA